MAVAFALIVLPQYFLYALILHFINKKSSPLGIRLLNNPTVKALLLTLLESFTPQQFPAHLGHPWMQLAPNIGLAPYIGAFGFSFFSYLLAVSFVSLALRYFENRNASRHQPFETNSKIYLYKTPFIAFLIFIGINFSLPLHRPNKNLEQIRVRLVQANIGSLIKVESEKGIFHIVRTVLNKYKKLTQLNHSNERSNNLNASIDSIKTNKDNNSKIDLIIWPETAYPNQAKSELLKTGPRFIPRIFKQASLEMNADFFTGGYDSVKTRTNEIKSEEGFTQDSFYQSEYNAAFFFHKDGSFADVYHKMKLIPFGEGLPFGPFNKFFSQIITNITYFAQGDRFTLFQTSQGYYFSSAICYEILFSNFIREYLNSTQHSPSFLINITNDSWYGKTSEPYQHLFLSKWRSIENNIPIIRMTNTGISSILYEDGSESERTELFKEQVLDLDLFFQKHRAKTIFQTYGFTLINFIALILLVCCWIEKKFFNYLKLKNPL